MLNFQHLSTVKSQSNWKWHSSLRPPPRYSLPFFPSRPSVFSTAIYRVLSSSCFPPRVKSYYCSKRLLGCVSAVCRERYPPATLITQPYLENTNSESYCYIQRERQCRSRVHSWAHSGQDVLVKISYFFYLRINNWLLKMKWAATFSGRGCPWISSIESQRTFGFMTGQMPQVASRLQRVEVVRVVQRNQVLVKHYALKCSAIGYFVERHKDEKSCLCYRNWAVHFIVDIHQICLDHLNISKDSLVLLHILGRLATRPSVKFSFFIVLFVYTSYSK